MSGSAESQTVDKYGSELSTLAAIFLPYKVICILFSHKNYLVLCQDLVQHKMRNFNYFQLTNSDSLATLAL